MAKKKYKVSSWKTNSTYIKSGKYYQTPYFTNDILDAYKKASSLLRNDKVFIVNIDKYDNRYDDYTSIGRRLSLKHTPLKEITNRMLNKYDNIQLNDYISDVKKKFKKGTKVKTKDGKIETVMKVNSNGNIETIEHDYSRNPNTLTIVSKK